MNVFVFLKYESIETAQRQIRKAEWMYLSVNELFR